jgi:hypothetical protein
MMTYMVVLKLLASPGLKWPARTNNAKAYNGLRLANQLNKDHEDVEGCISWLARLMAICV